MSSKLREALENARSLIYEGIETEAKDDIKHPFHLELAIEKIDEALAKPRRNCEVGSLEEQLKRFGEFCAPLKCRECRLYVDGAFGDCGVRWSQMPYESEAK